MKSVHQTPGKHLLIATLFLLISLAGCAAQPADVRQLTPIQATPRTGTVTFAGSTSLQPLIAKLGEAYQAQHPQVLLEIAAGGSGVGIQAIHEGTVDIGMASRVLEPAEAEGIRRHQVAVDVIAVVVNANNKVQDITMDQLNAIYLGQITNWQELGGPDLNIVAVSREKSSGTRGAFDALVLAGAEPSAHQRFTAMTAGDVAAKVGGDHAAVGYVGFGNIGPALRALSIEGFAPSEETVRSGQYPLVRPLLLLTGPLTQPLAIDFIDFAMSPEGQHLVNEAGWIAIQSSEEG